MFLTTLLKFWQIVVGAVVMAFIAYGIHSFLMWRAESSFNASLESQRTNIQNMCKSAQKVTEDASHEYQTQIADLNMQLDAAKRMRPHGCVPIHPSNATGGHHDTSGNSQLPNTYAGVDSNDLLDFAYDAEQVGRRLDACQSFVKKERE